MYFQPSVRLVGVTTQSIGVDRNRDDIRMERLRKPRHEPREGVLVLQYDPLTVTLWREAASARAFAYGPGVHKAQMLRQRAQNLADRTSFTRCHILRGEGTWHGRDPLKW
jgi:hypothetical protein